MKAVRQEGQAKARSRVRLCAQGDILVERVDDAAPSGQIVETAHGGPVVIAEGEATGTIIGSSAR
ncbi:MAG TPA: hypothetical protein VG758_03415 [Hyphomicrobiaceae bacterium]|jgi:hypothetical protein|nr:hypothetical protein [Hyphomicrobiaceae bacterium]